MEQSASLEAEPPKEEVISQCLTLLSQKDDTSRFVGLAMMLSIINHVSDPEKVVRSCSEKLNPLFLDRLLKAGAREQTPSEESKNMVELAVNVINAFARCLPDAGDNRFLVDRTPALIAALASSSALTSASILQILHAFATGTAGSQKIIQSDNLDAIVDASGANDMAIQVLQHAFIKSLGDPALVKVCLERFFRKLVQKLEHCERSLRLTLLELLGELLVRIPSQILPSDPSWTEPLYGAIRTLITSGSSSAERRHCFIITASLLHGYPSEHFFRCKSLSMPSTSGKPFIYLLLQLVTIDLRAAFPSLLEQLASPSYAATIQRLAAGFDIVASFLTFLMDSEDFESIGLDPEVLLKLRNDIGETFGLTIEFLRDRWDAAYSGAAGFEPGYEQDGPKGLTWDSSLGGGPEKDVLIIGAVRALSLWLKEDEALRKEAGGLMDVFLGLWTKGLEAGVDYRSWIIGALDGILEEPHGRAMFQQLKGWQLVWNDLKTTLGNSQRGEQQTRVAIEEARLLTTFVKEERFYNDSWARESVKVAANFRSANSSRLELELGVMMLELASECVAATLGSTGKFLNRELEQLCALHKRFEPMVQNAAENDELMGIMEDVSQLFPA
ncbi:Neurochondrin-domain-containing protein [Sphaerosporella brunnea]|uniref:Neurochondrin-domain-containing protein n=1 Tax=Sphaerosporella brunnea TaxID=1250544 RepID=A0A5J5EZ90_9PEZI|nr:Neurochondrin-domain-containing protein [Sphaerosporella brunnea]